jgi:hypothetical protein
VPSACTRKDVEETSRQRQLNFFGSLGYETIFAFVFGDVGDDRRLHGGGSRGTLFIVFSRLHFSTFTFTTNRGEVGYAIANEHEIGGGRAGGGL